MIFWIAFVLRPRDRLMVANMEMGQIRSLLRWLAIIFCFLSLFDAATKIHAERGSPQSNQESSPPVKLHVMENHVEMDNGIVKLTLLQPSGYISGIGYKEIDNVLEYQNKENQRGYWDIVWSRPENGKSFFDTLQSTNFRVIAETKDHTEVSFTKTWNVSGGENAVPLNIDKRFIVRRGVSGFYSYTIFEHLEGWPDLNIDEARIAFKLHQDKFHYMAISDDIQRVMPTDNDRKAGHVLDYKEAVLITNADNPRLVGEVDDKYEYSCDNKDNHVHGWISSDPKVGFWVITPSDEFRAGGPVKPDLTSHAGPTSLAMLEETQKWPYDFPSSTDFPRANQRGTISGRLLVRDRYLNRELIPAKSAYVGLAPPGHVGSWQDDSKGYQFWTQTNEAGHFKISSVRADTYNLYAWVPGVIGDYKRDVDIIIQSGSRVEIGDLVYDPPRNGPTLWEIGIPDRTAAEFYIPDPSSSLVNKLFINHTEKYRQYGLWDRYTGLYPTQDLVYTVGVSDYRKDWFFAHVNRNVNNNKYTPTIWRISFDARNVSRTGAYTLRLALASANLAEIQVWINNPNGRRPHFTTGQIGRDNTIARHGIHGRYWLYSVNISGFQLVQGRNTIYLKQARSTGPFTGVLYDYIRLEGPPQAYYD
ncbi:rhamnogalacturonate lyase [Phtheirospermum japonicum]|uniref:rhamnogalacturonan endolyase n=1 Tax=Phtheirospermum japonicum TaxID=374723 RepID=A0A830C5R7_9LAMI|nr:rhamnogalacturonate lyase [Phtheirospermum japonicum]